MKRILYISNYKKGLGGINAQVDLLCKAVDAEHLDDARLESATLDAVHLDTKPYKAEIFSTKGNPFRRLWLFLKLLFVVRRYDVLHIHGCSDWGMLPVVYGVIAGKIWKKLIIVTYHGGGANNYLEAHEGFARRWLGCADKVIVLNGYLKKVFDEHKIPCIVIPNIVPLQEDVYQPKESIAPKMISVRHLTDLYRIDLIIRAFAKVLEKYPEATLDILGQGDKREELERLVVSGLGVSGLSERVHFIGQVPNEKMYDYLKANDIMLSAPKIDNMPVSLMEAMNARVLVISSNVGGVPYLVEDQKTGLLFDLDAKLLDAARLDSANLDAECLAEKILWALEHQKESVAMIEAAHEEVKRYTWEEVRKRLLPLYEG